MAGEISYNAPASGMTITVSIYGAAGAVQSSGIAMTESPSGLYYADMPVLSSGYKDIVFSEGATHLTRVRLYWDGSQLHANDPALYRANVVGLSTFDPTTDQVTTDAASRLASQTDMTPVLSAVAGLNDLSTGDVSGVVAVQVGTLNDPTVSDIVSGVWGASVSNFTTGGTFGRLIGSLITTIINIINATVSINPTTGRMTQTFTNEFTASTDTVTHDITNASGGVPAGLSTSTNAVNRTRQ